MMNRPYLAAASMLLAFAATPVRADGVSDMRAALERASVTTPVKASIEARTWRRTGEGKDAEDDQGQVAVNIDDGARGLSILYSKDLLARIDSEKRVKSKNPDAKTPTSTALSELSPSNVLPFISAAPTLSRTIEKAVLKGERAETYQGKPARVLTFDIPMSTLSKQSLKYAKKFDSTIDIWIGADGMPLASRSRQNVSGRAFVVVSFESTYEESAVYALAGERLVTIKRDTRGTSAGAGEKQEFKNNYSMTLQ
ncbi:MAG: hypothetical protein V4723_22505 [Pseudomonadota bacterium]